MTKSSNNEYVIHFTQSKQVTGVPEGQIKRELRRLLAEAGFTSGYYGLRILVTRPMVTHVSNQPKLVISDGTYVNTMKIEFSLASGIYQGVLTHPDRVISGNRVEQLNNAAKRLPTLAQKSEDEVPKPVRSPRDQLPTLQSKVRQAIEVHENEAKILAERLQTLNARIRVLQGQVALPRSALHPSAKEPIRREITLLQRQIKALHEH